ncbi:MAG: Beta-barrel assembly-enhancing protease [Alphaproteobacteria bacterium MarineAlpha2_Bin1]|nr:MAG: Beta-barrel assembly-enhancing protease [Alphaproteobacteria bacterium MarineAlpha2_Bin1]
MKIKFNTLFILSILIPLNLGYAKSEKILIINDAEINNYINFLSKPLLISSGLSEEFVEVNIIFDDRINAFVANGQRIFIHSGLITNSDEPEEIVGVIAHEIGHIVSGHLTRTREVISSASTAGILAALFGVISVGVYHNSIEQVEGDLTAAAIFSSVNSLSMNSILKYSRTQELNADMYAINLLEENKTSGRGLLKILYKLSKKDKINANQMHYLSTHPLNSERISIASNKVKVSKYYSKKSNQQSLKSLNRIKAKINGFTKPNESLKKYNKDKSITGRIAKANSLHKLGKNKESIEIFKTLTKEQPLNPYFYESLGKTYLDDRQINKSINSYEQAIKISNNNPLILIGYSQALISKNNPDSDIKAIKFLEIVTKKIKKNYSAWRLLEILYGRAEKYGKSFLAGAEKNLILGNKNNAFKKASEALKLLKVNSPDFFRAKDIMFITRKK